MKNKRLLPIVITVVLLLLIPLIAMQFTTEVNWTLFDFVIAGGLLLSGGFLCNLAIMKLPKIEHRIAICLAILTTLMLIWAELAVGILGTPFAGT